MNYDLHSNNQKGEEGRWPLESVVILLDFNRKFYFASRFVLFGLCHFCFSFLMSCIYAVLVSGKQPRSRSDFPAAEGFNFVMAGITGISGSRSWTAFFSLSSPLMICSCCVSCTRLIFPLRRTVRESAPAFDLFSDVNLSLVQVFPGLHSVSRFLAADFLFLDFFSHRAVPLAAWFL
jgi:hypothetical protein